jgi:hypothetical protein
VVFLSHYRQMPVAEPEGSTPAVGGRTIAQAVSRRPLASEARVCSRVSPCGTCDEQSGTSTGFSPSSSVFLRQYHSTVTPHTYISPGDGQ